MSLDVKIVCSCNNHIDGAVYVPHPNYLSGSVYLNTGNKSGVHRAEKNLKSILLKHLMTSSFFQ